MHQDLERLQPYPFERLRALNTGVVPPQDRRTLALSIGEPQHAPPALAAQALTGALDGLARYPTTRGEPSLRAAIARWLEGRYGLSGVDAERQVLPVNGTREALFACAQAVVDRRARAPVVLLPNPFYQIYEGATLLAGATPWYYGAGSHASPDWADVPEAVWDRCQLLYLCSPGNPTGAVLARATLASLIERAQQHDFVIAADECYAEIYSDEGGPPPGLLEAATAAGYPCFDRCLAFHSLSKRSNLAGLRSGFVAGDAALIDAFARYRTYHGCAMAPPTQAASRAAWQDEAHVRANRAAYREKFDAVLATLDGALEVNRPDAGFYLWPRTPDADETFARELLAAEGVRVLPGRYLGRPDADGHNPGAGHVRMALVPPQADCVDAASRIRRFVRGH
jgi:N-succinyldiaminopimelate aminotransferase